MWYLNFSQKAWLSCMWTWTSWVVWKTTEELYSVQMLKWQGCLYNPNPNLSPCTVACSTVHDHTTWLDYMCKYTIIHLMSRIWTIWHFWKSYSHPVLFFCCCFFPPKSVSYLLGLFILKCFFYVTKVTSTLQIWQSQRRFAVFWQWFRASWWPPWGIAIKSKCI